MSQAVAEPLEDAPPETGLAFDELYRQSRDDVYAYAAGLLRDRVAAEDVTAAAFERAYRSRHRFDRGRGTPAHGCSGSPATRRSTSCGGAAGRHASLVAEPLDLADPTALQAVEQSERRLMLADALEGLGARERELVALKFFAGLSNAEIARVLGLSESNAGTKLHRAVNKLREACNEPA